MTAAALIVAFVLLASACLALGRWIGRRELTSMTQQQAQRHVHPPEVRGQVVPFHDPKKRIPHVSTRRG